MARLARKAKAGWRKTHLNYDDFTCSSYDIEHARAVCKNRGLYIHVEKNIYTCREEDVCIHARHAGLHLLSDIIWIATAWTWLMPKETRTKLLDALKYHNT